MRKSVGVRAGTEEPTKSETFIAEALSSVLVQQVPVVFGLGVGIRRNQPGERRNFRMDGWLRAGLEAVQVSGNDFGRGQAMLLRVFLEELNFLAGQVDCQCRCWHSSRMRCTSGSLKSLQHVFRQRGVEVIRHGELALGQTDGTVGGDSGSFALGSRKSH